MLQDMHPIKFECPGLGALQVMGENLNDGHDFVVRSNAQSNILDYLYFLDSRGISRCFEGSLAEMLIDRALHTGKTYLLICRPLELTIWATLIGFVALNQIKPVNIITNMGFVDFTPKKDLILQDVVRQVDSVVGKGVANSCFAENYVCTAGDVIPLYTNTYDKNYILAIEAIAKLHNMVILNTPQTDPQIKINRLRPSTFFSAQLKANRFNRLIRGAEIVSPPFFDESLTYDAVHFTRRGNELNFNMLKPYL